MCKNDNNIRNLEKISDVVKRHGLQVEGVVQVGAHQGQEVECFKKIKVKKIVCFEPLLCNFSRLQNMEGVKAFRCALGEREDFVEINVSSADHDEGFTMSSSLMNPKIHLSLHPGVHFKSKETVEMKRLSSFAKEIKGCNLLVIDVQGYEYQVLVGGDEVMDQFQYIYTEVNRAETYEGNRMVWEIDEYLSDFKRVETWWATEAWGDALYVRKSSPRSNPRLSCKHS